ncbi:glycoside hydrolase domain-containing protein [Listeria rocourtiae]|uniref:glycoside hydrolase domain-containing protein n=1 Tax=Listeria rocourtiae TaxID=647910 RepID=UPI003D2F8BE3
MDEMVKTVQSWLNKTYQGYVAKGDYQTIPENGKTGWTTVYALTRALQIELGISPTADNFGPGTEKAFKPLTIGASDAKPSNINYILQGAFYCKGYSPGGFTGVFGGQTQIAVKMFQKDAGLSTQDGVVSTIIMKSLLNMSAFQTVSGGIFAVRTVQQNLNRDYSAWIGSLVPCDGLYGRDTNTSLIYALQKEEGMARTTANGNFGPGTTTNLTNLIPTFTSNKALVLLLQYSLACNGLPINQFSGTYDAETTNLVKRYQEFMKMSITTGAINMGTFKALLSSAGDPNRAATACDTSYVLNTDQIDTLWNAGYRYVGRYLTGNVIRGGTRVPKAMNPTEIAAILKKGLKIFPIYQDGGYEIPYFEVPLQGISDGYKAIDAAYTLGFPAGTTIYFAVDLDAYDYQITDLIVPYFQNLRAAFKQNQDLHSYQIGVYGARNVCSRLQNAGLVDNVFVADMSTGFSGNLGFPMPDNWAFDQYFEMSIGTGNGKLDIDKVTYSGADTAVSVVTPPPVSDTPSSAAVNRARLMRVRDVLYGNSSLAALVDDKVTFELEMEKTNVRVISPNLTVAFTASAKLVNSGSGGTTISVKDGKVNASFQQELANWTGSLSTEDAGNAKKVVADLAAKIVVGDITVKWMPAKDVLTVTITANVPEIEVTNNYKTNASMSVSLIFDNKNRELDTQMNAVSEAVLTGSLKTSVVGGLLYCAYAVSTIGTAVVAPLAVSIAGLILLIKVVLDNSSSK